MLWKLLYWRHFDTGMGLVILINSLLIGLEQHFDLEGISVPALAWTEHVFLSIYLLELMLRFAVVGRNGFKDPWVCFDIVLVFTGVFTAWFMAPILGQSSFMVLRLGRLFRLARVVRLLVQFRELWMLVRGLLNCMRTILYTVLTISGVLFVLTCIAVELITKHPLANTDPDFQQVVQDHFDSFPKIVLTLIRFVTVDNAVFVYEPLVQRDPLLLGPYFLVVLLVVSIALMNLVTAVIVNSALEQASQDKEAMAYKEVQKKKRIVRQLRDIFLRLDHDSSGTVNLAELSKIGEDDMQEISQCLAVADPVEVFRALDVDESGELDITEFCDGIWQVMTSKAPLEVKSIQKSVTAMRQQFRTADLVTGQALSDLRELLLDLQASAAGICAHDQVDVSRSNWAARVEQHFAVPTEKLRDRPRSSSPANNACWRSDSPSTLRSSSHQEHLGMTSPTSPPAAPHVHPLPGANSPPSLPVIPSKHPRCGHAGRKSHGNPHP